MARGLARAMSEQAGHWPVSDKIMARLGDPFATKIRLPKPEPLDPVLGLRWEQRRAWKVLVEVFGEDQVEVQP